MALILSDGFSMYKDTTSATLVKNWSTTNVTFLQAGRWGAGSYCAQCTGNSSFGNPGYLTQSTTLSGSTTIVGVAIKGPSPLATNTKILYMSNGTGTVAVTWGTGGLIQVTNGSATTYYTATAALAPITWYYLEIKVVWSATTGRIVLRVDNAQVFDSGVSLNLGSSANMNSFFLSHSTNGSSQLTSYTDLLIMDGTGTSFNDFQGDVRIEALAPNADGANTAWTLPNDTLLANTNQSRIVTSTAGWATLTGSPTVTRVATGGPDSRFPSYLNVANSVTGNSLITTPNGTSGFAVTPGQTLGFGSWYTANNFYTFTAAVRFYDSGGTQVGADLAFGNATTINGTWTYSNITTNTVTVPAGAVTGALIITFNSANTYQITGFVLSTTTTTPAYVDPGTSPHFMETGDQIYDSDGSYVKSSTIGAKDTYGLADMVGTGTILGVRPIFIARKETSGPQRTMASVVRIGSTDYVSGNNQIVPSTLAYTAFSDTLPTSPATATTWTKTEVNGMEAGFDITQ